MYKEKRAVDFDSAEVIASWIKSYHRSEVPSEVMSFLKLMVLDTFGVMLASTTLDIGKAILSHGKFLMPSEGSYVFGVRPRGNPTLSAFIGGVLGHGDEIDEVHAPTGGHLAGAVLPACLSIGDLRDSRMKDFFCSFLIGYEVAGHLAVALGPFNLTKRHFAVTGVAVPHGCAAAASKLMELDADKIFSALGLASYHASGTLSWHTEDHHMTKAIRVGLSASGGVESAILAYNGYKGAKAVFDGHYGLFTPYAGVEPPEKWHEKIGKSYEIMNCHLKKYSAGLPMHTSLYALEDIVKRKKFTSEDIESIEIRMAPETARIVDSNPTLSINCCWIVASAIVNGIKPLTDLSSPEKNYGRIQDLYRRSTLVHDNNLSKYWPSWSTDLKIVLRSGETLQKQVIDAPGSPQNRLKKEEIISKYREVSEPVLGLGRSRELENMILDSDENQSIRTVIDILQRG